jgi:salicylate hydroxylase
MDDSAEEVVLKTVHGDTYTFDLVIGADGIKSFIRQQLMPDVVPKAPSKVAAYRGVLSYEQIFSEVPEARAYLRNSMDVWAGPNGYILTYPISGGKELNIVTAFCKDDYVTKMEPVGVDEVRSYYSDYSPVIQKVLEMVKYTQRWPLLQMPPLKSWSNSHKNVVLLGDAAHCMQNHMAQGAATAVEDGAFLGRIASEIVRGVISIREGIQLYEERRMPKAWIKQQITFVSGLVNMTPERMSERNQASAPEVQAANENRINHRALSPTYRSWQFYCTPETVPGVFFYDAEGDADSAVCEYLCSHGEISDLEMLSLSLKDKWWGYIDDNGYETAHHANRPTTKHLTEEDYKRFGKGL